MKSKPPPNLIKEIETWRNPNICGNYTADKLLEQALPHLKQLSTLRQSIKGLECDPRSSGHIINGYEKCKTEVLALLPEEKP